MTLGAGVPEIVGAVSWVVLPLVLVPLVVPLVVPVLVVPVLVVPLVVPVPVLPLLPVVLLEMWIWKGPTEPLCWPEAAMMVMLAVVPTSVSVGVPFNEPVLVSKLAQVGLPFTEYDTVPVLPVTTGW
jgi:hypothetical protein